VVPTKSSQTGKQCAKAGEDCRKTGCCTDPAMQCFKKNEYFATCKHQYECTPNMYDADGSKWSCEVFTGKLKSKSIDAKSQSNSTRSREGQCSKAGKDCRKAGCCTEPTMQCFEKNEYFATCKHGYECTPNMTDPDDGSKWSCKLLPDKRMEVVA
jgi:hypothetical protein